MVYRGIDASLPGLDLSRPYESTNVTLDRLSDFEAQNVREGIDADDLADAHRTVESLAEKMAPATPDAGPDDEAAS
jgi:PPM family protein phosphatase